jgi:hypothetical protein
VSEQKLSTIRSIQGEDGLYVATQFYTKLFEAETVDVDAVAYALDHAVAALRSTGVPPQRWAAFIHLGA